MTSWKAKNGEVRPHRLSPGQRSSNCCRLLPCIGWYTQHSLRHLVQELLFVSKKAIFKPPKAIR